MNEPSPIESVVMRRVRIVRTLRFVFSGFTVSCLLLVLAFWGIGREVWVARVFQNGPQDLIGHAWYLTYAFEHTRLVVQALSLLAVMSLVFLAREVARGIAALAPRTYAVG